jgi:mRNA-degrading endonuclease toxin of MazEF toxin-antitoxin module
MINTNKIPESTKYARGTVWWVELTADPVCSASQIFKRPCLIISNDEFNCKFNKITVIPLSTKERYEGHDTIVQTIIDGKMSYILCDQIRQVDFSVIGTYAFTLNKACLREVERILNKLYFEQPVVNEVVETAVDMTDDRAKISVIEPPEIEEATKFDDKNMFVRLNNSVQDKLNKTASDLNDLQKRIQANLNTVNGVESKRTKTITKAKSPINTDTKNKTSKKSTPSMPSGYFSDIQNNIDFWNDILKHSEEYMIDKYNFRDRLQLMKRKSRVKIFLKSLGYDITKTIRKK